LAYETELPATATGVARAGVAATGVATATGIARAGVTTATGVAARADVAAATGVAAAARVATAGGITTATGVAAGGRGGVFGFRTAAATDGEAHQTNSKHNGTQNLHGHSLFSLRLDIAGNR